MYWGNPGATPISNSAAVFDTANGFAGVWHLGENGDSIYDATGNAFNGKKSGSNDGAGNDRQFGIFCKRKLYKNIRSAQPPVKCHPERLGAIDTSTGRGQDIVSIGDAVLIRVDDDRQRNRKTGGYHNNPCR